ncbi:serine hydrolase domain-containing protein [Wenzhouxiangella sp. XN24]|uniref:serine hydrolase domain-containing protein n=1 Tax=Wenzhouxiangella sp. XN24 TaxID=2713569 RepID=UPI0013E9DB2A|nr:serine hydrolase domain-containing protein [Wenzhouxiangella sp. XN24]NGX15813.1 beta-lactamase family protein [Wenzhouxiangella sp. XN24]
MNHGKRLTHHAVRCALMLATMGLAGVAAASAPSLRLADDPRVSGAVQLWAEWVEYQASTSRVPGVSYGIVHDQELVASGAFGEANPATGAPATPDTLYSICSISKLFTSVALMQQRDAGLLRLDDPVAQHLDWFNIEDAHPADEPVTIRGLLTHSAGLPRESDFPYWTDPDYPFPTSDEIRARLGAQQTLYPSARYFQYSNLGLSLVGEIVVATSGQAFDPYIREHLLDPLGMSDTYTDIPIELRGGRMAVGHTALKRDGMREVVAPFQTRGIAPAAGFASSVNDMAKFAMWQFRLLGDGGDELLRASTLREMQRVHWVDPDWETTWGLGFSVRREGERTFARHGGGCPGYYTEFRLEPKTKLGAIVLTNTIGSEPGFYAAKAFDLIAPAIESALDAPDEAPARNAEWLRYTGVYDNIWGQVAIVPWQDGLALLYLGSRDPAKDMVRLRHVGEHTFRRVRNDDDSLGETVYFEPGEDGTVRRFKRHSIWMNKLR